MQAQIVENRGGGLMGLKGGGELHFIPAVPLSFSVSLFLCKGINEIFKSTGMCSNGELS